MSFAKINRREAGRRSLLFFAAAVCGSRISAVAETPEERQNILKAGFVYNFFSYVQWPAQSGESNDAPFVVGVVGEDALNAALDGKSIKGRRIEARKLDDLSKVQGCHILFVPASEEKRVPQILEQTKNRAVLTVGETSNFTRDGGMITLVPSRNRYQLEINPDAAERAGLTISSQLLKLARIVKS